MRILELSDFLMTKHVSWCVIVPVVIHYRIRALIIYMQHLLRPAHFYQNKIIPRKKRKQS